MVHSDGIVGELEMWAVVLKFLTDMFGKVFADVIKDIFNTPAETVEVEVISGSLDIPPSDSSNVLSDYGGMLNRG